MKAKEDKLLEELVDNIMKDSILESPSYDFTSKVMSKVLVTKTINVTVYKPLISKSVFILIFGCVIALFIYVFINKEPQTDSWIGHLDFSPVYNIRLTSFLKFSKITIYSVVLGTLMFFIQISFLKIHFDKQLEK